MSAVEQLHKIDQCAALYNQFSSEGIEVIWNCFECTSE